MVDGIRQLAGEDDEAFLLRAERVMAYEQESIRDRARMLVARAVRLADKPESVPGGVEQFLSPPLAGRTPRPIAIRAALLARSMCREERDLSTGPDPVGADAYRLLTQLALAVLAPPEGGSEEVK
jgi:hypothetical protein